MDLILPQLIIISPQISQLVNQPGKINQNRAGVVVGWTICTHFVATWPCLALRTRCRLKYWLSTYNFRPVTPGTVIKFRNCPEWMPDRSNCRRFCLRECDFHLILFETIFDLIGIKLTTKARNTTAMMIFVLQ